jgi:mRNA interferase RelE/StbE
LRIDRTSRFKKAWQELSENERKQAGKALENLVYDMRYPALGVKKIQGAEDIWEARVSRSIRLTFEIQGDIIILRNIGKHDETLKKP